jgi:hypothetical protein
MKNSTLVCAAACLLVVAATSSALALNIGSVALDLKSGGQDSVFILPGTTTLPVEIYFSATTSGAEGSNNGVSAIFMNLTGPAITGVMQNSVALASYFTSSVADGGLGFDLIAAPGTPGLGEIAGLGAAQALPYDQGQFPFEFDLSRDAPNVGHSGNVLLGTVTLNLASLAPGTVSSVHGANVAGQANLWEMGFHHTYAATVTPDHLGIDDLVINVLPEPTTLSLLALVGLAALRPRRG